jgi:peroxiredoxin
MLHEGQTVPSVLGYTPGKAALLVFFEADCPTCQITLPYLNALKDSVQILGISQDEEPATQQFIAQLGIGFPVEIDRDLTVSRAFDPPSVPSLFLLDEGGRVQRTVVGFDKASLNELAAAVGHSAIAPEHDGAPAWKPGCSSRHLEPEAEVEGDPRDIYLLRRAGDRASRINVSEGDDLVEFCAKHYGDALPVVPPTEKRVQKMLAASGLPAEAVIARVPPCYGEATVEKIAANAVMAGCVPEMMRVLLPLVRAACDERFNIHGVQATTHFAAPLIIVNGPVRRQLGFWSRQNVFSNVARANSTLGRALQLILLNLGGARPDGIDMSTLGNPGKFSYCIAENEEESPWEPLHVQRGLEAHRSAVTLFAAEPPRAVSEHTARHGRTLLMAVARTLATVWSPRSCLAFEALVVLCPEHVKTLQRDGFSRSQVRQFLFEHSGVPVRYYQDRDDTGEGMQMVATYREVTIDGEPCYQKFRSPEQVHLVVAGGTAGKFSAVIGSWATGPTGSQMVTYPIPD